MEKSYTLGYTPIENQTEPNNELIDVTIKAYILCIFGFLSPVAVDANGFVATGSTYDRIGYPTDDVNGNKIIHYNHDTEYVPFEDTNNDNYPLVLSSPLNNPSVTIRALKRKPLLILLDTRSDSDFLLTNTTVSSSIGHVQYYQTQYRDEDKDIVAVFWDPETTETGITINFTNS